MSESVYTESSQDVSTGIVIVPEASFRGKTKIESKTTDSRHTHTSTHVQTTKEKERD